VSLLERLERKIEEAQCATWDHARPLAIRLDPPPRMENDALVVGASFLVQARDGGWVEIHREPATPLADAEAVDDFLARGLSLVLMKHPAWPR